MGLKRKPIPKVADVPARLLNVDWIVTTKEGMTPDGSVYLFGDASRLMLEEWQGPANHTLSFRNGSRLNFVWQHDWNDRPIRGLGVIRAEDVGNWRPSSPVLTCDNLPTSAFVLSADERSDPDGPEA